MMMQALPATELRVRSSKALLFACTALCIFGICLRILQLGREGFWFDEIFGASYTGLSLAETLVAVLRFDLHPPLYYWQLNLWSGFGSSDVWLLLNSSAWSVATLLLLTWTAWRSKGPMAGLFVCALVGACATEVFYAGELRMYAMLSCLAVIGWRAADRYIGSYALLRDGRGLILVLLAIAMTHSMSMLLVSALLIYAFPRTQLRVRLRSWLLLAVIAALFLLPWLLNASFRSVGHTSAFSLQTGLCTLGTWLGWAHVGGGIVVLALIVWLLVAAPAQRHFVFSFVGWPLVFVALLSTFFRPLWIPRIFVFCALMFWYVLALQLADVCLRISHRWQLSEGWAAFPAAIMAAALASLSIAQVLRPHKAEFREAAADIHAAQGQGDFVYIPQNTMFWGIARYMAGPAWGSLLAVQDPVKADQSERWRDIYVHLGDERLRDLHLLPETRVLQAAPPLVVGWSAYPPLAKGSYWVVTDYALDPDSLPLCMPRELTTRKYRGLRVHHVVCGAAS